jgi:hypothetical protein
VYELKGRKFACEQGPVAPNAQWQDVEAIPVGALLRGTLRVLNLRPEELGGLLAAIGKEPASALKIGAGKGQRLGRIRLHAVQFNLRSYDGAKIAADELAWRQAFEKSQDRYARGEDALVHIHQGDC